MEKYQHLPLAQRYLQTANYWKTYFEKISIEQLKSRQQAWAYFGKGEELGQNADSIEAAKNSYQKAVEIFETLINKDKDLKDLLALSLLHESISYIEELYNVKIMNLKKAILIQEELLSQNQDNATLRKRLATNYGNLAWYLLFEKRFKETVSCAQKGLIIDSTQVWINTNLALGYLFDGQFDLASAIYVTLKDKHYKKSTFKGTFLNDLTELEAAGITHPDIARVRKLLSE